eukprot:9114167-Pyramimonas_sp.AAC.1
MGWFRQCMRDEVTSTFVVLAGYPGLRAQQYRKTMLNLFFSGMGPVSQALAEVLPNGDWGNDTRVEWYPGDALIERALDDLHTSSIAASFASCLMICLLPHVLR